MIVALRREKPTWGARKLRERLLRKLPNDVRVPACSTIHAILVPTVRREFYIRSRYTVLRFKIARVLGGTECAME